MRFVLLIFLFALVSCSNQVEISFPSNFAKENEVIINNEHNLKDYIQETDYSFIAINKGVTDVMINGKEKSIDILEDGLLNLNEEEFVIFPIIYGMDNPYYGLMPQSVLIDSTLFYRSTSKFSEEFYIKYHLTDYEATGKLKVTNGMASIKKTDLFTRHKWHIGLNDEIPEELEVEVKSENQDKASGRQYVIRTASAFKLHALLTQDYISIDLKNK